MSSLFATVTTAMGAETFDIAAVSGSDGFFGLTSASSFNSVKFTTEAGVFLFGGTVPFGGETFNVDNLALAQLAIPSAVPLPAARPMLAAGLGALGVARRRKRPKKS